MYGCYVCGCASLAGNFSFPEKFRSADITSLRAEKLLDPRSRVAAY